MKRKHLVTKTLAIVLSAALCAGGTGIQTYASSVELSQSETEEVQTGESELPAADTVSANDTDTTGTNGETAADSEEITDTEETDTDAEKDAEDTEKTAEENDLDADEALQMPAADELLKNYANEKLTKAVIELYNKANNTQYTANNFTIGLMSKYEGSFDFTKLKDINASDITDITGLGYARAVSSVDISTTNINKIAAYEFSGCDKLTQIKLPKTLMTIENNAFSGCDKLQGIDLPIMLTKIGASAFGNCSELAYINTIKNDETVIDDTLPDGLESIETNAFDGCAALRKIIIPNFAKGTILEKAASLFANCKALSEVKIGSNIQSIPNACFYKSGDEKTGMTVTIEPGSKLDKIMVSAFDSANIENIDLSMCSHLAAIEARAFAKGTAKISLTEIRLPVTISDETGAALQLSIGKEAFYQTSLVSMYTGELADQIVTLPDYVKSVGVAAFAENESIKELVLGSSIKKIEDFAFNACKNLEKVTQNVTTKNDCATESIGTCAFRETGFADASFLGNMNHLKRIGGEEQHLDIIEDRDKSDSYSKIKKPNYTKNYVLKNEKFGSEVFTDSKVQTVVLPASVEVIESRAFYNCAELESVTMQSGRTEKGVTCQINTEAFRECEKLKTAILPNNEKIGENLEIDKAAFLKCEALDTIATLQQGKTYNSTFPKTISKLADNAFDTTALRDVTIQDREDGKMPEIGTYVFRDNCNTLGMGKVTMPQATVKLTKGLFYDSGVSGFVTSGKEKNLEEIEEYALFGNTIQTLDLSAYTKLKSLGDSAFAYRDLRTPVRASKYWSISIKKIILPKDVEGGTLSLGSFLLRDAYCFDTLSVKGEFETDGIACIPDYVPNAACAGGTFAGTAVKETFWQYTKTGVNPWTYIPQSMFNASDVENISKCLLPAKDLKEIKEGAFLGCQELTSVDLRAYDQMETMGEGVFSECFNLISFYAAPKLKKLPKYAFFTGFYDRVTSTSGYKSNLQYVDLGNITELEDYCFASVN